MNWDDLNFKDWIDIQDGFVFYVDCYIDGKRVASKLFELVEFAKQYMEYVKLHEKNIDEIQIIAVRNTTADILDFENFDEYWADVEGWVREEVK